MKFFLLRSGNQLGPYSLESLPEMKKSGQALSSDYIWVEGTPSWVPLSSYAAGNLPAQNRGAAVVPSTAPSLSGPPPLPPARPAFDNETTRMIQDVEAGGRFVVFTYCISVVVLTFKRSSGITFLRRDDD